MTDAKKYHIYASVLFMQCVRNLEKYKSVNYDTYIMVL